RGARAYMESYRGGRRAGPPPTFPAQPELSSISMEGVSMSTKRKSRRAFLVDSALGLNAAWVAANYNGILAAQKFARDGGPNGQRPKLSVLTADQAAEVEAMTAQIIPADETGGAKEARCVYFIDRALATFAKNNQPTYVQGLRDLQTKTEQLFPGST